MTVKVNPLMQAAFYPHPKAADGDLQSCDL